MTDETLNATDIVVTSFLLQLPDVTSVPFTPFHPPISGEPNLPSVYKCPDNIYREIGISGNILFLKNKMLGYGFLRLMTVNG